MDHELLLEVIRKTARKMTDEGMACVAEIPLDERARNVLAEAMQNGSNDLRRSH
jgi:hypothetical protein